MGEVGNYGISTTTSRGHTLPLTYKKLVLHSHLKNDKISEIELIPSSDLSSRDSNYNNNI